MLALQFFVAALGVRAVCLSIGHALFFMRTSRRVGRSMVYMLVEQMVSAAMTLAFAANSLVAAVIGVPAAEWNMIDARAAIVMRLVMFAAMIHSTQHLSKSVRQVIESEKI